MTQINGCIKIFDKIVISMDHPDMQFGKAYCEVDSCFKGLWTYRNELYEGVIVVNKHVTCKLLLTGYKNMAVPPTIHVDCYNKKD